MPEIKTLGPIFLIVAIAVNLVLATLVYRNDRKSAINRIFAVLSSTISVWLTAMYFAPDPRLVGHILWLSRLTLFLATPMNAVFFLFAQTIPSRTIQLSKNHKKILIVGTIAVMAIAVSPFAFTGTKIVGGAPELTVGWGFAVFGAFSIASLFAAVYILVKKMRTSRGTEKRRLLFVITGLALMSLLIAGTIFLPVLLLQNHLFVPFAPLYALIFLAMTAYAIFRHKLFDIRSVIQKSVIYSFLATIFLGVYLAALFALSILLGGIDVAATIAAAGGAAIVGIFGAPFVENYFRKRTDEIFFRDRYVYAEAIHKLSETLGKNIDLAQLLAEMSTALKRIFKAREMKFLLLPEMLLYDDGSRKRIQDTLSPRLLTELRRKNSVFVCADIPQFLEQRTAPGGHKELFEEIYGFSKKYAAEIMLPIALENKLLGILMLGEKHSGDTYSKEDIKLLQTFSGQAAVALSKAELYKQVRDYSRELEQKVKTRTAEIGKLQESQKQMMIDIAHALQTPLTAVRGELGFLKKQARDRKKIEVLERSVDEVSRLVYDFLNLSRLEAERQQPAKKSVDMSDLLKELVEYFDVLGKEQKIVVVGDIESHINLRGRKDELTQLVTNLVSNAFKYLLPQVKKEVVIGLHRKNRGIELVVKDSGRGISAKDLPFIFDRFYRAKENNEPTKGTGLGLALCKRIAERHNATIRAESKLDKGTTFIVNFTES